jgi:hypothetical protein
MDHVPQNIRSGQGPMYVEVGDGQSLEQSIVKIVKEMYSLLIRHVKQSGRSHPHPYDFQSALKVVLLPSYSKREVVVVAMTDVTHIENAGSIAEGPQRTATLASLSGTARLVAGADCANELLVKRQRTRSKKPKNSTVSLFPAPEPVSVADQVHVLTAVSSLLQMSDMPDELEDEFCFCDDETQLRDNDMFLMANADKLWDEYLKESSNRTRSLIENTLVKAVIASDKTTKEVEARARAAWEAEQEEWDEDELDDEDLDEEELDEAN